MDSQTVSRCCQHIVEKKKRGNHEIGWICQQNSYKSQEKFWNFIREGSIQSIKEKRRSAILRDIKQLESYATYDKTVLDQKGQGGGRTGVKCFLGQGAKEGKGKYHRMIFGSLLLSFGNGEVLNKSEGFWDSRSFFS